MIKMRRRGQSLRKNQTKEENHLWYDFLKTYPVQYRRQYQIGPYYMEFFCYQAALVVELDGSQHYEPEKLAEDQKRTAYLKQQGITVLRFPNTDVWKNFCGVCEAIDLQVKKNLTKNEGLE